MKFSSVILIVLFVACSPKKSSVKDSIKEDFSFNTSIEKLVDEFLQNNTIDSLESKKEKRNWVKKKLLDNSIQRNVESGELEFVEHPCERPD